MIGQSPSLSPVEAPVLPYILMDPTEEYYQSVLRHLHWPGSAACKGGDTAEAPNGVGTLGVTSCARREGVSTVAARLAVAAARMDEGEVLLVDANLTHPVAHHLFDVDRGPGLSELLLNPTALPAFVQPSGCEHLALLTAGEPNGKLPKAFDTVGISNVIESVGNEYDLVVFDMPPAGEESAALRLAGMLDAIVIVVEAERVRYEVARRTKHLLDRAGASVRGAVLNKRREYVPRWLYRML